MVYIGITNTLKRRSNPNIALGESIEDGGQLFMSLYTRKEVHSDYRVELPIYYEFVKRV